MSAGRDIQIIRRSLSSIARALSRLAPPLQAVIGGGSSKTSTSGRKLRLSPARRRALRLQGQYMGHLRSLRPRQKAQVKAARAAKGVRSAIGLAKRLAQR